MPPAYPTDIAQEIDRRWHRRSGASSASQGNDYRGGGRCPACNQPRPSAPIVSEYRGVPLIHHHWLCGTCGHEWMTAGLSAEKDFS